MSKTTTKLPKTPLSLKNVLNPKSDPIESLPIDETPLSYKERTIIDNLYPTTNEESEKEITKPVQESLIQEVQAKVGLRELAISMVLFIILNLPTIDSIFKIENPYYRTVVKSLIFATVFFVIVRQY
jgi:hypothetical protein